MINLKIRLLVLLIGFFIFTPFSSVYAGSPGIAPLNPVFIQYQTDRLKNKTMALDKTSDGYFFGERPSPTSHAFTKIQTVDKTIDIAVLSDLSYDSSYDLRNYNKVTPVRDQANCGACWTFAAMATAESYGLTSNVWDFSEQDMNANHGFDWVECTGGNDDMATAYNSRWSGPLNEVDNPYPYPVAINIDQATTYPARKHVQEVIKIPLRSTFSDNDTIKHFITTNGAVYVSFYSSVYFSSDDESYYNPGTGMVATVNTPTNHAVAVIGWDDNYASTNFKTGTQPPGDGAFLIRNSYGTSRHGDGYFWLSYYDTSFKPRVSYSSIESNNNYKSIYQYDPLGYVGAWGEEGTTTYWGANVFVATSNDRISAVGFHLTDTNASYEIYVYTNVTTGAPKSGTLATSKIGSEIYPGYYTIDLDSPVLIANGQNFSIVIKIVHQPGGYESPLAVEYFYTDYSEAATSNANESFYSQDGTTWTDFYSYNPSLKINNCIKAFTKKSFVTAPIDLLLLN